MHFSFFKILLVLLYLLSPTSVYSIEPPKLKNLVLHKEPKKLENVEFKNIDNNNISLKEFRGNLVILNFWATWCAPCREEMPSLDDLSKSNQFENLSVIPINVGREKIDKSINFFKDIKIENLKIFHDSSDELPTKLSLRGIPTTIFVNKDGLEFARVIGSFDFYNSKFIKWLKIYD